MVCLGLLGPFSATSQSWPSPYLAPRAASKPPVTADTVEADWTLVDGWAEPGPRRATLCMTPFSLTISGPSEKGDCEGFMRLVYRADLLTRRIYWGKPVEQDDAERESTRSMRPFLRRELNADGRRGALKLEALRSGVLDELARQRAREEADKVRADYLAAFEAADTLAKILAFESRYERNDPDGLVAKLVPSKKQLFHEQYRRDHDSAQTLADLSRFVRNYSHDDPDSLIPDVQRRIGLLERQAQIEQQRLEKQRQEELRQKELAERQAAAERDRFRLQSIQRVRTKYSGSIVADSAEARRMVDAFKIDCRLRDRRVLPLTHALYAGIMEIESPGVKVVYRVQSRGRSLRIYSEIFKDGRSLGESRLTYEMNEWGELRPVGFSIEAVLNNCLGGSAPLWIMPGEPGY